MGIEDKQAKKSCINVGIEDKQAKKSCINVGIEDILTFWKTSMSILNDMPSV